MQTDFNATDASLSNREREKPIKIGWFFEIKISIENDDDDDDNNGNEKWFYIILKCLWDWKCLSESDSEWFCRIDIYIHI